MLTKISRVAVGAAFGLAALLAASLPTAASAVTVTFNWVPISENPAPVPNAPSTAHGSMTLDIPSWTLTAIGPAPNFGPNYYTSGSAVAATITALSYTFGNGVSVGLSNLSATSITARTWATSALDTPASGAQAPSAPLQGYYLVTGFGAAEVHGTSAAGTPFSLANAAGTPGAAYQNGIGNGGNSINPPNAIADGGYWVVAPAAVPLPATLPLLISGLAGLGGFVRRRGVFRAARITRKLHIASTRAC